MRTLLKICSKLSSDSTVFKDNGPLTAILIYPDENMMNNMITIPS